MADERKRVTVFYDKDGTRYEPPPGWEFVRERPTWDPTAFPLRYAACPKCESADVTIVEHFATTMGHLFGGPMGDGNRHRETRQCNACKAKWQRAWTPSQAGPTGTDEHVDRSIFGNCSTCKAETVMCCTDCGIEYGVGCAHRYVCAASLCRNIHEARYHPGMYGPDSVFRRPWGRRA